MKLRAVAGRAWNGGDEKRIEVPSQLRDKPILLGPAAPTTADSSHLSGRPTMNWTTRVAWLSAFIPVIPAGSGARVVCRANPELAGFPALGGGT